ncbi:unnamed protein product [Allacma fusca]|uniref:Regucalcin n=1 Tax=Allacma fusca TaxID=39272 RepID=A0A8J2P181_9HEXA|nr:unnamed protein product [Allacma fusca]
MVRVISSILLLRKLPETLVTSSSANCHNKYLEVACNPINGQAHTYTFSNQTHNQPFLPSLNINNSSTFTPATLEDEQLVTFGVLGFVALLNIGIRTLLVVQHLTSTSSEMSYKIEVVVKNILLGEGPHWSAEKQELIYVDLPGKHVHRYVPATGKDYSVGLNGRVTFVIPIESEKNKYVISLERDIAVLEWDGVSHEYTSLKTIHTVEHDYPKNRFNDAKCDPQGRIWTGTMGDEPTPGNVDPGKGNIYCLDLEGKLNLHVDKIGISNGLAWSKDSTKFFYIDSVAYSVDVFDFNAAAGTISNRRVLFDLKKHGISGLPDGMCTDIDGNLWVAVYMGGKILHLDSKTGNLIKIIDFTGRASKITSAAFGGPNLDELYVTSATLGLSPEQLAIDKDAGALFKITNLGTRGASAVKVPIRN